MKMESNIATDFKTKEIVTIATLLRDRGDKILNFSCKLSLTVDFLVKLNEAFDLIADNVESSSFQVINTNNSSIEFLHDLQFLHDFVQKVLGLRLWCKDNGFRGVVSLEKFRAIRFLDLYSVNIQNIGIGATRDRLKSLICVRSNLLDVKHLLDPEDTDAIDVEDGIIDNRKLWTCLEEIFLPHNAIESLGSSLSYVPHLKVLDLSHNNLRDIKALDYNTQNLEWLNVSYNRLKTMPTLNQCTKLKVILLSDNQLDDLKGLGKMTNLNHIDASRNLIKDHNRLSSLINMSNLERLQLEGNPIAFKRGHRLLTVACLNHLSLASRVFYLDGIPISSMEKSQFSMKPSSSRKGSTGNEEVIDSQQFCDPQSHPSCSSTCLESQNVSSTKKSKDLQNVKPDVSNMSRSIKIREAPITEGEESNMSSDSFVEESSVAFGNPVHLETKKDIESLRKDFGEENWLKGGGGMRILDILGLQVGATSSATLALSSKDQISQLTVERDAVKIVDEILVEEKEVVEMTEVEEAEEEEQGVEADDKELTRRNWKREEDENGVEIGIFLVQKKRNEKDLLVMDDLLVVVTDRFLLERDGANGNVLSRWDLNGLLGTSEEENNDTNGAWITVTFKGRSEDVVKRSYFLDNEEAKDLLRILNGKLEEMHATSRNSAVPFTCIRCSADFFVSSPLVRVEESQKKSEGESSVSPKCPKCGSAVVMHAISVEPSNSLPVRDVLDDSLVTGNDSLEQSSSINSEFKSPFASWSGSKLSTSMKGSTEASDRGLQLYVLLNVLPDGGGKENEINIHEVLIYQESSEESFLGHIVLSKDSIYILRQAVQVTEEDDGNRRASLDENNEPILVEWHPISNCQRVTHAYSGYIFQFGPHPISRLWVFPRNQKQMQGILDDFCSSHPGLHGFHSGLQKNEISSGLGEILMAVPLVSHSPPSYNSQEFENQSGSSDAQYGIFILTSMAVSIMDFKDFSSSLAGLEREPLYTKKISDLVGLDAAKNSFFYLPGVVFQFSGEADDEICIVWPWGEGLLMELVEALRKPWENMFSIPLESIVLQTSS